MNLEETSFLVLSNLQEFKTPKVLDPILKNLDDSSISHHRQYYEAAKQYYERHQEFPTSKFLLMETEFFTPSDKQFCDEAYRELVYELRNETIQVQAMQAISKGDLDGARKALGKNEKQFKVKEFGINDVLPAYTELASRPCGILIGVPEIDDLVKGFAYTNMTAIAAPPGSFKTTLMISAAYQAVFKDGFNFDLFSLELQKRDIWFNFMARHSYEMGMPLDAQDLKKGLLTDDQKDNILPAVVEDWGKNCRGKINVISPTDVESFDPHYLDSFFEREDKAMGGLDGFFLDYIQLLRFFRPRGSAVDEFLNDMVRYFTNLCVYFNERGLIGFILSQINREGQRKLEKKRKADAYSFAEINAIEREAHNAIVLFADESMKLSNNLGVQIVKNRSGSLMEQLAMTYVNPKSYVVGSAGYKNVFSENALDLLGETSSDDMDLFG